MIIQEIVLDNMKILMFYWLLFFFSLSHLRNCNANDVNTTTLKQIHLVFRHGERSPTEVYRTDPNGKTAWIDGLGQLTKRGKLQMYTLGQSMRHKYANYIPEYYFPKDVKVLSSYSDRCLMSAQLFNSGLFIPKNEQIWNSELLWQPIPISYKPREEDNMIAAKQSCRKYDDMYKELYNTPKYRQVMENCSELFNYLTKSTGKTVDNLREVERLYNTLVIEKLNNMTLPQWADPVFPTQMKALATLSLASYTETDGMKRLKGGTFVKKVLEDMKNRLVNENSPKIYIYSGHDITLVNILRTLDLIDEVKPNFAAYLILELHHTTKPFVKIFYNNCGWCEEAELKKNNKSPIDLNEFEDILTPIIPINWNEECNT